MRASAGTPSYKCLLRTLLGDLASFPSSLELLLRRAHASRSGHVAELRARCTRGCGRYLMMRPGQPLAPRLHRQHCASCSASPGPLFQLCLPSRPLQARSRRPAAILFKHSLCNCPSNTYHLVIPSRDFSWRCRGRPFHPHSSTPAQVDRSLRKIPASPSSAHQHSSATPCFAATQRGRIAWHGGLYPDCFDPRTRYTPAGPSEMPPDRPRCPSESHDHPSHSKDISHTYAVHTRSERFRSCADERRSRSCVST